MVITYVMVIMSPWETMQNSGHRITEVVRDLRRGRKIKSVFGVANKQQLANEREALCKNTR